MRRVISCIAAFLFGYILFTSFSFRVGYHPFSLRISGASRALDRAITTCFTGNDNDRTKFMVCAQKKLNVAVGHWGLPTLMEALAKSLEGKRVGLTQCHDLAHAIGWAGVVESRSLSKVIPKCTNTCVYGCGHGAIAAWYALGNDIVGNLSHICIEGIDWSENPQGLQACFHEIGHAVASIAGNNMEKALEYCDMLDTNWRLDCARGVFMELFEPATFATQRLPLPPNHPYWCEDLWYPYKGFCFEQAGTNEYGYTQDTPRAVAVCNSVPVENRAGCFRGLGQNIFYVYQHKQNHVEATIAFCRTMGTDGFPPCIQGILSSSVAAEPTVAGGIALCQAFMGDERDVCVSMFADALKNNRSMQEQEDILGKIQ